MSSRLIIVLAIVAVTVGLDQWTKYLAIEHLQGEPPIYYFGKLFDLSYAENTGAFLSLGENLDPTLKALLLNALPGLLLIGLLVYIFRDKTLNKWQIAALAFIVGGGLSNIVDRVMNNYVVDMLHIQLTESIETGVFNVADMAIMLGMFMMLPAVFRGEPKPETTPTPGPADRRPLTPNEKAPDGVADNG